MDADCIRFDGVRITELQSFPPEETGYFYVTLNAEIALLRSSSTALQQVLSLPTTRVSVDGQWIAWALRRKYPGVPIAKLSGSDLVYRLADYCNETGSRLFLLGSSAENNRNAVQRLREQRPEMLISGYAPPAFDPSSVAGDAVREAVREQLESFRPRYLVCCLGTPKEQTWALLEREWLDSLKVEGTFFFGGAIDFVSGSLRRAPEFWQRVGLEGLYRVIQQPRRFGRLLKVLRVLPALATGRY
jgi:N-acetylglucosaminyldiphosphoundecaprenol N-acetyl-beta-D-mannosaminyltransferase